MDETSEESILNTQILLARNSPVALVVGASGFLGSHLVDKLLSKGIQIIGVEDIEHSKKENLKGATGNKNFHLLYQSFENLNIEIEHLDYIFVATERKINLTALLEIFKKYKSRLLLISSVNLYSKDNLTEKEVWLESAEIKIAKQAKEHNLNARILRLGPVFGPRMIFNKSDPVCRLIAQSLKDELQKEASLEFSERSLFVDDAVDLAIKCIMAGATAQKIFDGVAPTPVKVSEVKQILLDPVWYESKDFKPTELPPWPTPNLEKTIKFLNWKPKAKLVESLKKTIEYFRDSEIELDDRRLKMEKEDDGGWKMEKKMELEGFKKEEQEKIKLKTKRGIKWPNFKFPYQKFFLILALSLITYALIWPVFELSWGILTFRFQLKQAVNNLKTGDFEGSLLNVRQASLGAKRADEILNSLEPLRKTGVLRSQFELGDNLSNLANESVDSAQNTILGIQALYLALKCVSGEINKSPKDYFDLAKTYLASADESLSKSYAILGDSNFKSDIPGFLKGNMAGLREKLSSYSDLISSARALSLLLPEVVALDGSKSYLILLQDNSQLRGAGGLISSIARVDFDKGKIKKLDVVDVVSLDSALTLHVEPPKEIKDDLGQKDYLLRDSNWEPDFPTSARQAEWFYNHSSSNKETGERVEGVIGLDISALADLQTSLGGKTDNLFEKVISQKSFLKEFSQELLNKLFFLPNQNWPAVASSLGRSLKEKHMSIYLDNPVLFSYLVSEGWSNALPRQASQKKGAVLDFLAPVEANLGGNEVNYYLDRRYSLETVIGQDGQISHTLRIAYTNRDTSGKYKNRMRIYLPFGTKLNKASWGEIDITKSVSSFVDYGRSGYSFLLGLLPKEAKTLSLEYQIPDKLSFLGTESLYKLNIIKQAGILKDSFDWTISYPLNLKLVSNQAQKLAPHQQTIKTDLSEDRNFQLTFQK